MKFTILKETELCWFLEIRNSCSDMLHDTRKFTLEECENWYYEDEPLYWKIEENDIPVGYFRTSKWSAGSLYIGADIHQDFRGQGIATRAYPLFMKKLVEEFQIQTFLLEVKKVNELAFNLYKKLNFKIVSETEDSYKMRLDYDSII